VDTNFGMTFPDRRGQPLNPRGFGQVWYAIARDQIAALRQQQTLKRLTTLRGEPSNRLRAKQGQIYQLQLQSNQKLKLRLKVTAGDPRLSVFSSVFSQEMALVRLTADRQWSITALAASRYDIVITPSGEAAVTYQLQLES
jgi:serine/threonine protein kinase, bacterial